MKRFIISFLIATLAISGVYALSYEPSLSILAGSRGTEILEDYLRTSGLITIEAELPTITFGDYGRLSIPFGISLNSGTRKFRGLRLYGYMESYLGISYDVALTSIFSLGAFLKGEYRYYEKIDSSLFGGGVGINLLFRTASFLKIVLPMEISFFKGEMDYSLSIGTRFTFGGWK